MDSTQEKWIDAVRVEVDKSTFESDHKSALQRQLDHAAKLLNGSPDKMAIMFESTAEKIVRDVRQEICLAQEIKKHIDAAINDHTTICKMKRRPGLIGLFDRVYEQSPVMALVLLFWLFQSPYGSQILQFLGMK